MAQGTWSAQPARRALGGGGLTEHLMHGCHLSPQIVIGVEGIRIRHSAPAKRDCRPASTTSRKDGLRQSGRFLPLAGLAREEPVPGPECHVHKCQEDGNFDERAHDRRQRLAGLDSENGNRDSDR